jgi:hypothetical protein
LVLPGSGYTISFTPSLSGAGSATIVTTPTLTFTAIAAQTYGAAPFAVSASSASTGAITYSVTSGPATISGSTVTITGVGSVVLGASQAAAGNYTSVTASTSFAVIAANLTITASSPTVAYGAAVPTITPSYSGFVNGQTSASLMTQPTCITAYTTASAPGSSPSTSCSGAVDANYAISYVNGVVTVNKANLTITASSPTVAYGAAVPTITPSYSGFVNGQTSASLTTQPTCITAYTTASAPGSSPSTSCSGAVDANYAISYVNGAVTVNKATPSVTAWPTASSITYGQTLASSTLGVGTASVAGSFAFTTPATAPSAGTASQSVTFTPSNAADYNSVIGSVSVTVSQATPALTFTAIPAKTYGVAPFPVSASSASIGAITYTVTSGPATISGSTVTITGVGTVMLGASQAATANYTSATASTSFAVSAPAPTYVQQCNQYMAGTGSGQSASCALTGVTTGDTLVIGVWTTDATLSSVTSTVGTPTSVISNYAGNNGGESIYLLPDAASGSITITATETGYYNPIWLSITEFTNVAASPLDASVTGSTGNSSWAAAPVISSNFTTTATNDMLFSMCIGMSGETFTVGTAPITWTQLLNSSNYVVEYEEDGLVVMPGTYNGQCYKSSTGYDQDILTVALKDITSSSTPTFSPVAGTYTSIQRVTISDSTSGALIYYTTNGSTPTTSSTLYSGPITVSNTETVQAIAIAPGYLPSVVGYATYVINLPTTSTPTFNPLAGTYISAQTVTISDSTSGSSIYYTTNGSTPTTSSTLYSGPITVSNTETVQAIATATGYLPSVVGTATFTIDPPAATPTLSPGNGTYITAQTVTISDSTSGSSIHYTTDGTTPTTSSTLYSGPITVSTTATVKAVAIATGNLLSAVGSAVYTINPTAPSITSLSPTSGTVGTQVTLTGVNFGSTQGASTVTFNGTAATSISLWSATSIVAVVPTGATTGNVVVTVGGVACIGVPFTVVLSITTVSLPTGTQEPPMALSSKQAVDSHRTPGPTVATYPPACS